jgi:16S rRNA (cytidine1402-2'-O)-methyltransferase|tara:strand:+ start:19304 stop:20134 length:831 start_codon:yes stop_codon:yes gene_type:complete
MIDIKKGKLFVVGLPIGNLEDISLRVKNTLDMVDIIASEDTRNAIKILSYLELDTQLISYHDHSDKNQLNKLINYLKNGKNIALISDSGTPLICDPGYRLVRTAIDNEILITVIPGSCALITALAGSGLPTDRFIFEGFFSKKMLDRKDLFFEKRTIIFYESVHRVKKSIIDMIKIFGPDRQVVISRELTKLHEGIYRGSLIELSNEFEIGNITKKGEFVILVSGNSKELSSDDSEIIRVYNILNSNLPSNDSLNLTSKITGSSRNYIYKLVKIIN